jgi:ElaB/YqjD/DUF883 family membrane-anchored ribosome-binding protein
MTIEEIEIIVTAKVEEALKGFEKLVPGIKKELEKVQESFSKINISTLQNKIQKATNFIKNKMRNLKKDNQDNAIIIKVNNQEAIKQTTQLQKEIDSLQKKISEREIKLNITNGALDKMKETTRQNVSKEMPDAGFKRINQQTELRLFNDDNYVKMVNESDKLNNEIIRCNALLDSAKSKMTELENETNSNTTTQRKMSGFFSMIKQKIEQAKASTLGFKNNFKGIPKVTQNITNNIKNMGNGLKGNLKHVLKYAAALFSLRGIYSVLSNSARSWLSSQNAGAQQLSANIEYMKYAMGSMFAPVIEYVINLVYQLMKAIQSLAYAFTGVNIFAKATASSMKSASGSAKQTSKSLSGIHSEINNVSDNKNSGGTGSGTPNIDLSKVDKTPNKIIDVIKNGNWNEIGAMIGEKLNNALAKIPWDKIQSTAKNIASGIAQTLNGFIAVTDWKKVGDTVAQGLNTAIYFAYNFVTTFDWKQFGIAIGDAINGFFHNIDWSVAAKTLSDGIKGIFDTISSTLETIDWQQMARDIEEYVQNIDWSGIVSAIFRGIGTALGGLSLFLGTLISDALSGIGQYFDAKIEECGGNIVAGIFKGIVDAFVGIGQWINDNIFKPFIDGFKSVFGIHSPSTVMAEMGGFLIEGLKQGLLGIWEAVAGIFKGFAENVKNKFNEIKNGVSEWAGNVKSKVKECWDNVSSKVKEKVDNVKSSISTGFNNARNTISNWGNNVKSKISECWSNASNTVRDKVNTLKNNISTGLNNAKTVISGWGDNIKTTFTNLGRNATTWGKDLTENMASGIRNTAHKVGSAVQSVASKIKGFLGFSEPEEGPLSNFHTYMPDMIDLMVKGIKDNVGKVKNEIENLAGTMSYTINTEAVTGIPSTNPTIKPVNVKANNMLDALSDIAYKENENNKPIYLTVNVGNAKLGQILLDNLRDMKRQTGKDIEALVGG